MIFLAVWPWNWRMALGTSPKQHQALCIISSSYVNSNWSYGPESAKLGVDLCDLDLWPWPFAWTSLLSLVITPENFMLIRCWEHSQKGVTDRETDRQTDWTIHRAAWSQLKMIPQNLMRCRVSRSMKQSSYYLVCSMSLMASLIRSVGGLSKCFFQGLWLAVLSSNVIGQSINRRGVA